MGRSYLELVFRHKLLMVLPVVLCVLVGGAVTFMSPRAYVAAGSAWAEAPPAGDDKTPPSTREQVMLTQLLSTRAFLQQVAAGTPLSEDLAGASPDERDALLGELQESITAAPSGPDVLSIAVESKDPQVAVATASSVVEQFNRAMQERADATSSQTVAQAKAKFDAAAKTLAAARKKVSPAVATAVTADPSVPLPAGSSPETVALQAAQTQYEAAATAYAQAQLVSASPTLDKLTVIDEADRATPQPRMKALVFAVAGGGIAGLTISACALLVLMATDRRVRVPADLTGDLGLTVVAEVPEVGEMSARRALAARPAGGPSGTDR